ncbi:hypothetical protein OEZ86_000794 [Tetradesmus obliquus]|nr:hypothetical protein OEZ86_000794 [Tetradesmus obliquus]
MVQFQTAQAPAGLLLRQSNSSGSEQLEFQLRGRSQAPPFCSLTLSAAAATTASANGLQLLPVGSNRGGKQQQFAWDGSKVIAINKALLDEGYTAAGRLHDSIARMQERVRSSFIPRKEDVTEDYWEWLRWRCGQRFFSAVLQNFATQSLLMAVGVGARKALAASAAINWMLKDGMNRLVRMGVATQFGDSFDSDLKRFRFTTSLLYTACVSCEFLTPRFPSHFLLLTAVSNVGRAVGLTTFVSTQPAFQQALCASGNMADLASKTQAQHMVMDTLALAVSATANYLLRHQESRRMLLPLVAFPLCGVADLFCIYHELKAVQLRSLNRERAEMVAEYWLREGRVPSFRDISSNESLLGTPNIADNLLPMRITPLEGAVCSPGHLQGLLGAYKGSKYLMALQPAQSIPWWNVQERCLGQYKSVQHIAVCLQTGAKPRDILTAVLEAAYMRRQLQQEFQEQQQLEQQLEQQQQQDEPHASRSSSSSKHSRQPHLQVQPLHVDSEAVVCSSRLRRQARSRAEANVDRFMRELSAGGWQVRPFLLSTSEKSGFVKY